MTAEVIVMNRKGVALAADSAGTLSLKDGYKIYNSNDKLYQVSDKCHIGLLTYGHSSLNGAPFELILGRFKAKCKETIWDNVNECKLDFLRYLDEKELGFFSNEEFYVHSRISDALKILEEDLDSINENIRHLEFIDWKLPKLDPEKDADEIDNLQRKKNQLTQQLNDFNESNFIEFNLDQIVHSRNCCLLDDSFYEVVARAYWSFIEEDLKKRDTQISFEKLDLIIQYCVYAMFKDALRDGGMGVAFAGFGESEFYPSCEHVAIFGRVCGKVIYRDIGGFKISTERPMYILPLAQTENVDTFIFGISPMMEDALRNRVGRFFAEAIAKFGHALSDEDVFEPFGREKVFDAVAFAKDSFEKDFDEILSSIKSYNRNNIYEALNWLSIPDMAKMAKSLIELTTFKKKMSTESDTVGGPIDVAVISKNDGFCWIEKKKM